MSQPPDSRIALPGWLIVVGSVVIAAHLLAVGAVVLAAPSGPWWVPQVGPSQAEPPTFAGAVNEVTAPNYLAPLKLAHNYHFNSNRTGIPGVELEARLKFKDGTEKTLWFPDQDANPWVRHRQALLVQALAPDRPVMLDPTKGVALVRDAARKRTIKYWEFSPTDPTLRLKSETEDRVPRNREVFRPSEWSLLLAESYGRYLCREYGAQSVELIRHTQEAISPVVLLGDRIPQQEAFTVLKANFGEFSK